MQRWKAYYEAEEEAGYRRYTDDQPRFRTCLKLVGRGFGSLLDAGCGEGHWLQYLSKRFPQAKYTGIGIAANRAAKAQDRLPGARLGFSETRFESGDRPGLRRSEFPVVCGDADQLLFVQGHPLVRGRADHADAVRGPAVRNGSSEPPRVAKLVSGGRRARAAGRGSGCGQPRRRGPNRQPVRENT